MTYNDLPSVEATKKLTMVAFSSPSINLWAYQFNKAVVECADFVENERRKLVSILGETKENGDIVVKDENLQEFVDKMKAIKGYEIERGKIPFCDFDAINFEQQFCSYHPDKAYWMNANDINEILKCVNILREEQ